VLKVQRELKELLVLKVHKVLVEVQVHKVLLVRKVHKEVFKVPKVLREIRVQPV
jgi:hypothetical protein